MVSVQFSGHFELSTVTFVSVTEQLGLIANVQELNFNTNTPYKFSQVNKI